MHREKPPTLRRERRPDGLVILVTGSSGSGKSSWTAQQVASDRRLLVWDVLGEWARKYKCKAGTWRDVATLAVPHSTPARVGLCVPPTPENFAHFCRLAWVYLQSHGAPLVVEELSDVTTPGKAPIHWGEIVRKSRHFGSRVYGLTQRPAECDKTIVGNAAVIHSGLMSFKTDRAYMARCLDLDEREIAQLAQLDFIEKNMRTREIRRGKVTFRAR
jgi:hypothetical protein